MADSLGFELFLLERMSAHHKATTLREIGLAEAQAATLRAQCPVKLLEQLNGDIALYTGLLGRAAKSTPMGSEAPEPFVGSTAYSFLLMLWPHLYWVVNARPDGSCWGVGFQNQVALGFETIDPTVIRVGLWTQSALEALATRHELYDGWDERVVVHFDFGIRRYAGTFVFGLLQEWRSL